MKTLYAVVLESAWGSRELTRCNSDKEAEKYIEEYFKVRRPGDPTLSIKKVYVAKAA